MDARAQLVAAAGKDAGQGGGDNAQDDDLGAGHGGTQIAGDVDGGREFDGGVIFGVGVGGGDKVGDLGIAIVKMDVKRVIVLATQPEQNRNCRRLK